MIQDPNDDPVDPELDEAIHLYRSFMEEIKIRLSAIDRAVSKVASNPKAPYAFLAAEFGFLQLRYVFELVALSALIVHKPYGLSPDLLESWNARRALNDLAATNSMAFPLPAKVTRLDNHVSIDASGKPPLTRIGLQRIYNKIGRILHRGPIKHILGRGKTYDVDALQRWAKKMGALLANHVLLMPDQGIALVTHLTSRPDASVRTFLMMDSGPFDLERLERQ